MRRWELIEVGSRPALARLMWFTPIGSKSAVMMQTNQKLCTIGLGQGMRKSEIKGEWGNKNAKS